MISTRSAGLLIDTVVCLTLAKWETVSGRFGGYLTTLLEVVEGSTNIDGQYDRDTGAMLFQLHRYIETWVGPRCPEYEGGCAVCYMWAIYDKLAKYTQ